ncbi:DUF3649 domain-containing protein [Corticibacter populi]|uniref:DUF3649 domain-containing protein n=1 Tax=Corticibacter populi TaxID=1550736 RepID=A0A3M6QZ45_9BURK|nr:DUF3649 domain-containing protein [Corticibacter populi]RMX08248.1 DUF3649 domain-containing protein [Corticibacter populi]RZS35521.1 uncharacterized protein DUF3649 [Corticibacter populi]
MTVPTSPPDPGQRLTAAAQAVWRQAPLVSRIAAALFGGYALAAQFSIAALALPLAPSEAAFTGMLGSFLVYAIAVIWVFAVRSAWRAWAGLLVAAVVMLPFTWMAVQAGASGGAA